MILRVFLFGITFLLCRHCLSGQAGAETGTASYYADSFEGRRTSSGEIFRQDSLTAAHKTLPFGTRVRVTNLSNDSTVVVRINDRLPARSSRVIDLSRRAASQLNFIRKGLQQVNLEILTPAPTPGLQAIPDSSASRIQR